MYKKDSQDISEQDFQQHNKLAYKYCQRPSPKYSAKPNEFDKLVYVASTLNEEQKNNFKHSKESPFQSVAPRKQ
jgi:hypothetical protein